MADINKNDLVGRELTWKQIQKYFPNQWVGLIDVDFEDDSNIKTAVVKYIGLTDMELYHLQKEKKCLRRHTNPNAGVPQIGVIFL